MDTDGCLWGTDTVSKPAPFHGAAILTPAHSREMAETLRRAISVLGGDNSIVLDPLTIFELEETGRRLSEKYQVDLLLRESELEELRLAIAFSNGLHLARSHPDLPDLIRRLADFQLAVEEIRRAADSLYSGFHEDTDSRGAIDLVVAELVRAGSDLHAGAAQARIQFLGEAAAPIGNAVATAHARLSRYASRRGRPQTLKEVGPFCECCESVISRQGIRTTLASEPPIERAGILLELALTLQAFLLPDLRTPNPSAWAQRFRAARRRRKPRFDRKINAT